MPVVSNRSCVVFRSKKSSNRAAIARFDRGDAEYVVTVKNNRVPRIVHAAFPGTLVQEILDAEIAYSVRPKGTPTEPEEREIDATTFRRILTDPRATEERARIESIRARSLGRGTAKYTVALKPGSVK